jgi:hypothetical protein
MLSEILTFVCIAVVIGVVAAVAESIGRCESEGHIVRTMFLEGSRRRAEHHEKG